MNIRILYQTTIPFCITLLLLLFTGVGASAQQELWYRVITSNNKMWSPEGNFFITPLGNDSFSALGFSNQGATVHGTTRNGRINIPLQTTRIIPFGGGGKLQWDITVAGKGTIGDTLAMQFFFKQDSFETMGEIKAVKWDAHKQDAWSRQFGLQLDTTIKGFTYSVQLQDSNGKLTEAGENYSDKKRNGRWLKLDNTGRPYHQAQYVNDTLHGWCIETGIGDRTMGLYLHGKKVGRWAHQVNRYEKWLFNNFILYDMEGNVISKGHTYKNGATESEIFYSPAGKDIWHTYLDEQGNLYDEGVYYRGMLLNKKR